MLLLTPAGSVWIVTDEPTQETPTDDERETVNLPGRGGYTIPVPEREDVMAALRKVAKAEDAAPADK